nr:DUF4376 domain-containing protein [Thioalkalivibrio sp. ARh3]
MWHDYGEGFTSAPSWSEVEATLSQISDERGHSELLAQIAEMRWQRETGGTALNGIEISTDRQSQALITGAFSSAKDAQENGEPFTLQWKGRAEWVQLDADQVIEMGRAVRSHVQACFDREKELADAVADDTFTESMLDEGWPE